MLKMVALCAYMVSKKLETKLTHDAGEDVGKNTIITFGGRANCFSVLGKQTGSSH